jgi:hypothetical protein
MQDSAVARQAMLKLVIASTLHFEYRAGIVAHAEARLVPLLHGNGVVHSGSRFVSTSSNVVAAND